MFWYRVGAIVIALVSTGFIFLGFDAFDEATSYSGDGADWFWVFLFAAVSFGGYSLAYYVAFIKPIMDLGR